MWLIGTSKVDPSPGILLVPVGALLLLVGVGLVAWAATRPAGPPP
jgi:hypothetical protein